MDEIKFEAGNEFNWRENHINILNKIGSGMTADVYRAVMNDKEVAIKVLKPGVGEEVRKIFLEEPANLSGVKSVWKEKFPDRPLIIPDYFGSEVNENNTFIVMELIRGEKLAEVAHSSLGLKEDKAYWIGTQIGDLLNLLHQKLNKCYSDIKIDNFWLIDNPQDANRPWLKITDWSILAEKDSEAVQRDLFFASLIMNYVFMGTMPEYSRIRISTRLEDAKKFVELSTSTKEFLNRSLSQNLSRRYQDSQSWLDEVNRLYQLWCMDQSTLMTTAIQAWQSMETHMSNNEHDLAAQDYSLSKVCLEIAMDRFELSEQVEEYWGKVKRHEEEQSYFGRGKISLLGSGFEQAINYFLEGADIYPTQAEDLWRWSWLARGAYSLGMDNFRLVRDDAIEAISQLVEKNTTSAETLFLSIMKRLENNQVNLPDGFIYLLNEARIINLCAGASDLRTMGEYDQAIEKLRQAEAYRAVLPEEPPIHWVADFGNISQLLDELLKEKRTLGESSDHLKRAKDFLNEEDIDNAAREFRFAYTKAPDSPKVIQEWQKATSDRIAAGKLNDALVLIQKAYGINAQDSLSGIFTACMDLHALDVKTGSPDDLFIRALNEFIQKNEHKEYIHSQSMQLICMSAFTSALASREFVIAAEIAQAMVVLWPELKNKIFTAFEANVRTSIELLQQTYLTTLAKAGTLRLAEKESQADVYEIVKALAGVSEIGYNDEAIDNHAAKTITKYQSMIMDLNQKLAKSVERFQHLAQSQQEAIVQKVDLLKKQINDLLDPMDLRYSMSMDKRVAKALRYLEEWAILGTEDQEEFDAQRKKLLQMATVFGIDAWKEIIAEADYLLEGGYFDQAQYLLDDLDVISNGKISQIDPNYAKVKLKLENISRFLNQMNHDLNINVN